MAFANLFTKLSAMGEDAKCPGEPAFTHSSHSENDKRSNARKRKPQALQGSPYNKKQRYQEQKIDTYNATSFEYNDRKSFHCHWQNTDGEHASTGFTMTGTHYHNDKGRQTDLFHKGRNCKTKKKHNVKKQQEKKKMSEGQKNQPHLKYGGKNTKRAGHHQARQNFRKGGGEWKQKDHKLSIKGNRTRVMTQEFKDQNALLLDGRLLCRHHLWGRCIKGEDCQLEHIQGYNDLIKEVCKFYVQGFCTKGESCPYMHKSFPCKFFHKKGKCSQGTDCRFSHELLNDVTKKLLDEVLEREHFLHELAKKAEQDSSGQPANAEKCELTDTNTSSDILIQSLRPNFYNSEKANVDHSSSVCQAEELSNDVDETHPPQTQPHSTPSVEPVEEGPVCYSVEAVLGRQHFKPFPTFITTPQGQDSDSLPSSDCTTGSGSLCEVPYSVNTFFRSCKSGENSALGRPPSPSATQTVSCASKTDCEEGRNALSGSEVENKQVRYKINQDHNEMVKGLSSRQIQNPTLVCGNHKKQSGEIPESLNADRSVSNEVKLKLLPQTASKSKGDLKRSTHLSIDGTCAVNTKSECTLAFAHSVHKSLTCTPRHLTELKPNVSCLTSQPQALGKSSCFSTNSSEPKSRAVSTQPVISFDKTGASGNSVSQSAHCTSKVGPHETVAETHKVSTISFHSLFASPLPPAPLPSQSHPHDLQSTSCFQDSNQLVDIKSNLTDSKIRASHLDIPQKCQRKNEESQTCYRSAEVPTNSTNKIHQPVHQRKEQQVDPTYVLPIPLSEKASSPARCGNSQDPSSTQSNQQQLSKSSHKESAAAATTSSVLKTLFLCLSPYQQESVQLTVSSGSENDKSSRVHLSVKTQQKNKINRRRKKKMKTQNVHHLGSEKPATQSTLEAQDEGILCSPAMSEHQVRSYGTHDSPVSAMTQAVQHHSPSKANLASKEGKCVNGNVVTPLKDLFKTLDTNVFCFGQ